MEQTREARRARNAERMRARRAAKDTPTRNARLARNAERQGQSFGLIGIYAPTHPLASVFPTLYISSPLINPRRIFCQSILRHFFFSYTSQSNRAGEQTPVRALRIKGGFGGNPPNKKFFFSSFQFQVP